MPQKRKDLKIKGANLWYLAGLITSDGCLFKDGRHIDITSADYEFLNKLKDALELTNRVTVKYGFKKQRAFHMQIGNRNFYNFLLSIGLTPNKSLSLGAINAPSKFFIDFLRGVIDGDGGMQRWIHCTNGREQWNLRIASGSMQFLEWLQNQIEILIRVQGRLHCEGPTRFRLKYGKMAAKAIVKQCYYQDCLGLDRKIKLARECFDSYRGWDRSKTVLCGFS
ncbi:MAG TPA: LAGLIDADG family homing endonuclease [Candidatus Omnitrophota bacterium]|nr:LAGLIDADG family homing endonuclease [Candidatus Omnitrophota bacterium]